MHKVNNLNNKENEYKENNNNGKTRIFWEKESKVRREINENKEDLLI